MALKTLSRGFLKPGDKERKFDQITIKICGRPCSISFSPPKSMSKLNLKQNDDPQLIEAILSDVDWSNIKIPKVPPKEPQDHYSYIPEFITAYSYFDNRDKYEAAQHAHIDKEFAIKQRDERRNERAQIKYREALAKFEEKVKTARNKIEDKKREIAETFGVYTFYIYKDNLFYFNAADVHSEEDQKLIIKKYYVGEQKKLDKFQKELEIIERLASEPEISREPIPENIRMFVWRRDRGKCVKCGSKENLEFDHIIPVSKGGSNTERNIQILCEYCNREKSDKI